MRELRVTVTTNASSSPYPDATSAVRMLSLDPRTPSYTRNRGEVAPIIVQCHFSLVRLPTANLDTQTHRPNMAVTTAQSTSKPHPPKMAGHAALGGGSGGGGG